MADPFVFKINNPPETGESIAQKLNTLSERVNVDAIRGAVSRDELHNHVSSVKSDLESKIENSYKKTFTHVEATYTRGVGNTKKMNDLRYHGGGTQIAVSALAPTNPKLNDLWFDIS